MYDIVQHTNADRFNFTDPFVVQLQKLSHFTSRNAPHRITSSFLPRSQRRSNGRWNSIEPPNRREGCRSPGIYLQNGATSGFEWPQELPTVSPNNVNTRQQPCTSYPASGYMYVDEAKVVGSAFEAFRVPRKRTNWNRVREEKK